MTQVTSVFYCKRSLKVFGLSELFRDTFCERSYKCVTVLMGYCVRASVRRGVTVLERYCVNDIR